MPGASAGAGHSEDSEETTGVVEEHASSGRSADTGWTDGLLQGLFGWLPGMSNSVPLPGAYDASNISPLQGSFDATAVASGRGGTDTRAKDHVKFSLTREPIRKLQCQEFMASGPLLLLLPAADAACEAAVVECAASFRGCLRGVCLEGTREEAERLMECATAEAGPVSSIVVFSRHGDSTEAKVCCYRGEANFDSLSYFCASVLHADHLLGAGAFLRPAGFVRYLCPDSILEVVGNGGSLRKEPSPLSTHTSSPLVVRSSALKCYQHATLDANPPVAILVTRSATAPEIDWFRAASRIFAPRIRSFSRRRVRAARRA